MAGGDPIQIIGKVATVLPGALFRVELQNGHQVLANVSGKLRKCYVQIAVGDKVKLEMLPYDLTKGRIVLHMRGGGRPPDSMGARRH